MSERTTTARRLDLLSAVVSGSAQHPQRSQIDRLSELLLIAGATTAVAPLEDGRRIPAFALDVLSEARDLMESEDFHMSAAVLDYAVAPALGALPEMKPLNAVSEQLARQDFDLQARRRALIEHEHLDATSNDTVSAVLAALAVLHYKHERLAAVVVADNARPRHRGKAPYRLAALQGEAEKAAAAAGPTDGEKLIAALAAYGLPGFLVEDSGISYVLVAVDGTADEGLAHTGPKVYLYSGRTPICPPTSTKSRGRPPCTPGTASTSISCSPRTPVSRSTPNARTRPSASPAG
ncbi:hypothetical protein E4K10_30315 [Streptomyces sp. T1317-0309]|nr:hypothetical protein E4K10_30315 [Streptomyces sp. T1317-0309]